MADLSGLHLLVTRPAEQGETWALQLHALGAEVTQMPVMRIAPLSKSIEQQAIINQILSLDECRKVIFVSQNAVRMAIPWIDQYWPQLPDGLEYFAVGQATAALLTSQLNHLGAMVNAPEQAMNSEELLALPGMQCVDGEKILIFKGQGGRTYLAESLIARGALVNYCNLYRREKPGSIDSEKWVLFIRSAKTPIVVVHSGETLDNLCCLIQGAQLAWLKQQAILVPGQRVADKAAKNGFEQTIVAQNATHDSMVKALYDWKKNGKLN